MITSCLFLPLPLNFSGPSLIPLWRHSRYVGEGKLVLLRTVQVELQVVNKRRRQARKEEADHTAINCTQYKQEVVTPCCLHQISSFLLYLTVSTRIKHR